MIKNKFLSVILSLCMILSLFSISAWAQPTLVIGDFDYSNIKISISADTLDSNLSEAMVYVIKSDGNSVSDSNPPLYMDFVTLTQGAFSNKEIPLPLDLAYGSYKVAVYYEGVDSPLTGSFIYYSPSELLNMRKLEILSEAKAASDANSLKAVFFDVDSAGGTKLPVNEVIVASSADFTDYNSVSDKIEVYNRMIDKEYKKLSSFDALIALFEECATAQKDSENRVIPVTPQRPSTDNSRPGTQSGSISVSTGGSSSVGGSSTGSSTSTSGQTSVFSDMKGHWAEKYANALHSKNIINGYEDGTFKGQNNVTRAEITKMLVSGFNINGTSSVEFNDVAPNSWYRDYVAKASAAGVVNGYNGSFNPNGNITRQDAALMVFRVLDSLGNLPTGSASFKDDSKIAAYASAAVKALGAVKILTGDTNGNFNPGAPITRAEIAAVICRALDYAQLN